MSRTRCPSTRGASSPESDRRTPCTGSPAAAALAATSVCTASIAGSSSALLTLSTQRLPSTASTRNARSRSLGRSVAVASSPYTSRTMRAASEAVVVGVWASSDMAPP